jgi:hypothetical protein
VRQRFVFLMYPVWISWGYTGSDVLGISSFTSAFPFKYRDSRARLTGHGARQRMGGEMKGQQENGVGIQHASPRPRSVVCPVQYKCYQLTHTPRLPVVD